MAGVPAATAAAATATIGASRVTAVAAREGTVVRVPGTTRHPVVAGEVAVAAGTAAATGDDPPHCREQDHRGSATAATATGRAATPSAATPATIPGMVVIAGATTAATPGVARSITATITWEHTDLARGEPDRLDVSRVTG